jgi:hypothetical protein
MSRSKENKELLEAYKDVTVADMNVDGMPGYRENKPEEDEGLDTVKLSKAEERAMIKGAYQALMPAFFIGLGVFCLAFGVLMLLFWLKLR